MAFQLGRLVKTENDAGQPLANLSNIGHGQYLSKLSSMPTGWTIIHDQYGEEIGEDDEVATIVWQGPWSSRIAFHQWVIGYAYSTRVNPPAGTKPTGIIQRVVPLQHPEKPWLYAAKARLVKAMGTAVASANSVAQSGLNHIGQAIPALGGTVEQAVPFDIANPPRRALVLVPQQGFAVPDGFSNGGINIVDGKGNPVVLPMPHFIDNQGVRHVDGKAQYEVTYRPRKYEVRTDQESLDLCILKDVPQEMTRYVERRKTYSVQALQIAKITGNLLKFTAGPNGIKDAVVPEPGVLLMPQYQLVYTWHDVPDPDEFAIRACVGRTNNRPFDGIGGEDPYPAESLLLEEPAKVRGRNCSGRVSWTVQLRFNVRMVPDPNDPSQLVGGWNFYPASDGNYYPAQTPTGKIFKPVLMDQLFVAGAPNTYQ